MKEAILTGGALMGSSLLPANAGKAEASGLTILHTNDMHSRLEPFPMDGGRNEGLGGVAARAELIRQIRAESEQVLLFDSGDMLQGTPYFNLFKGEPEIKAMSRMGYDAATIGEHDLDGGIENFAKQLTHANFPVIICNYDFTGTAMEEKYIPYKIFKKGNNKIGVLGVGIELKGLVAENIYGKIVCHDPVEKANQVAGLLKKQGCEMVICLSHLGDKYPDNKISDEILAKENFDIDLILGGHTHHFFDKPRTYKNRGGGETVVNQAGWAGIQLGRLDYSFRGAKKKSLVQSHTVVIREKTKE